MTKVTDPPAPPKDLPLYYTSVLGDIQLFAGPYAPAGYSLCDGSLLKIKDHPDLFSVLGTTFGGDGSSTFGLPDLRGRVPIGVGYAPGRQTAVLGQQLGSETVTMTKSSMPTHNHLITPERTTYTGEIQVAKNQGTPTASPNNAIPYNTGSSPYLYSDSTGTTPGYLAGTSFVPLAPTVGTTGEGKPIPNIQPELALNYIICTQGPFPNRNIIIEEGKDEPKPETPTPPPVDYQQQHFLGQVRPWFNTKLIPQGWVLCEGGILTIDGNSALYAVIGNIYGGDPSRLEMKVPNLKGMVAVGAGTGPGLSKVRLGNNGPVDPTTLGEIPGVAEKTIEEASLPAHSHPAYTEGAYGIIDVEVSSKTGTESNPAGNFFAVASGGTDAYADELATSNTYLAGTKTIANNDPDLNSAGGSEPVSNLMPFISFPYIICIDGLFPSRAKKQGNS